MSLLRPYTQAYESIVRQLMSVGMSRDQAMAKADLCEIPQEVEQPPEPATSVITVRLTKSQHNLLKEAAHISYLSLNQFCVQKLLAVAELTVEAEKDRQEARDFERDQGAS